MEQNVVLFEPLTKVKLANETTFSDLSKMFKEDRNKYEKFLKDCEKLNKEFEAKKQFLRSAGFLDDY